MTRWWQPASALNQIGAEQPRAPARNSPTPITPAYGTAQALMDVLAALDVATDPAMMAQIRESERQLAQGEGAPIAELEARLARDAEG